MASVAVIPAGLAKSSAMEKSTGNKLKIMVVGAHPDDPKTGMGGTICKYTGMGHDVAVVYFTAGEAGIEGVSHSDAAIIRKKKAEQAFGRAGR